MEEIVSTPSEVTSFNTNRPSDLSKNGRRTREVRKCENRRQQKVVFNIAKDAYATNRKSIESITVYKGPAVRAYSINNSMNESPTKRSLKLKQSPFSSFDQSLQKAES